MIQSIQRKHPSIAYRVFSAFIAFTFVFSSIIPPQRAQAQTPLLNLPVPGTMVPLSPAYTPAMIKGINIDPQNPLQMDFIIDSGDTHLKGEEFNNEATKLIKYFLASLTIKEEEMWVNLSPYEKDRIIPEHFSQTEMGRDLLVQDYLLKQLTASLMYPEDELGQEFWDRVYTKAQSQFGTTEIPMNTFNKVWIIPETANVYEHEKGAFVVNSHLKVMLEEDYLALESNRDSIDHGLGDITKDEMDVISGVSSEIVREILIPEIEKEVNEGKTFANLRQIFNSMILATWYKQNMKESLLGQVYVDQNKIKGVELEDPTVNQQIYDQYVEAFKKGVYNYIKEDIDPATKEIIPRKYFSGGFVNNLPGVINPTFVSSPVVIKNSLEGDTTIVSVDLQAHGKDAKKLEAIASSPIEKPNQSKEPLNMDEFRPNLRKNYEVSYDIAGGGLRVVWLAPKSRLGLSQAANTILLFDTSEKGQYQYVGNANFEHEFRRVVRPGTRLDVRGKAYMRRAVKLLLLANVIDLWESSENLTNEDPWEMYEALARDPMLEVSHYQDKYRVKLSEEFLWSMVTSMVTWSDIDQRAKELAENQDNNLVYYKSVPGTTVSITSRKSSISGLPPNIRMELGQEGEPQDILERIFDTSIGGYFESMVVQKRQELLLKIYPDFVDRTGKPDAAGFFGRPVGVDDNRDHGMKAGARQAGAVLGDEGEGASSPVEAVMMVSVNYEGNEIEITHEEYIAHKRFQRLLESFNATGRFWLIFSYAFHKLKFGIKEEDLRVILELYMELERLNDDDKVFGTEVLPGFGEKGGTKLDFSLGGKNYVLNLANLAELRVNTPSLRPTDLPGIMAPYLDMSAKSENRQPVGLYADMVKDFWESDSGEKRKFEDALKKDIDHSTIFPNERSDAIPVALLITSEFLEELVNVSEHEYIFSAGGRKRRVHFLHDLTEINLKNIV